MLRHQILDPLELFEDLRYMKGLAISDSVYTSEK